LKFAYSHIGLKSQMVKCHNRYQRICRLRII